MNIKIREYTTEDAKASSEIWNQVVDDGVAFPQEEDLTEESGDAFFKEQTYTGKGLQLMRITEKWLDFTFFIRIILEDVVIYVMPVMQ